MKKKVLSISSISILISLLMMYIPAIAATKDHHSEQYHCFLESALTIAPLQWQAAQVHPLLTAEQERLQGGIAAAISGLLVLILLLRKRLSLQQQVDTAVQALKNYTLPPQALAPGLAAHLCGYSSAALATLFDLAQRGFLRIEEREPKWGQRVFEVVRLPTKDPLQPHEEAFLDTLFYYQRKDSVLLSQVTKLAYSKSYQKALDDELILRGWHSIERIDQRRQYLYLSASIMAIGFVLFVLGNWHGWSQSIGAILIGGGSGLILAGLGGVILAPSISTLTEKGKQQATLWQSFAGYLKEIAQDKFSNKSEIFERYLPFAAGFGLLFEWMNHFGQNRELKVPDWFSSLEGYNGSDGLVAMLNEVITLEKSSSILDSAPNRSPAGMMG